MAIPLLTLLLIWMILSLVMWLVVAGLSVMAFDSGVTAESLGGGYLRDEGVDLSDDLPLE